MKSVLEMTWDEMLDAMGPEHAAEMYVLVEKYRERIRYLTPEEPMTYTVWLRGYTHWELVREFPTFGEAQQHVDWIKDRYPDDRLTLLILPAGETPYVNVMM